MAAWRLACVVVLVALVGGAHAAQTSYVTASLKVRGHAEDRVRAVYARCSACSACWQHPTRYRRVHGHVHGQSPTYATCTCTETSTHVLLLSPTKITRIDS